MNSVEIEHILMLKVIYGDDLFCQGNDFYRECGDVFSCHAIDNPDEESEIELLKNYSPSVPVAKLKRLVAIFRVCLCSTIAVTHSVWASFPLHSKFSDL